MTRRRVGGFVSGFFSLVLLLAFFFWRWANVKLDQPDLLAQVKAEVDGNAQQARTYTEAQNGWTDLAPWLATANPPQEIEPFLRASELVPPEATAAQVKAALAVPATRELLRSLDTTPLENALARPVLAWGDDDLHFLNRGPNLGTLRVIVRALVLRAALHEQEGRFGQAAITGLGALRLAGAFSGEVDLDSQIRTAGAVEWPSRYLLGLVARHRLTAGELRKGEFIVQRLDFHPTGYGRSCDRQFVVGWLALEQCRLGKANLVEIGGFGKGHPALWESFPLIPGWYFQRQQRLLANWYLARRPKLQALEAVEGGPDEFGRLYPNDGGARLFVLNYGNSAQGQRVALTRVQALLLALRLERFKLEKGRFPARLEEMKPPARNYLASDGKFLYRRGGSAGYSLRADASNIYVGE